MGVWVYGVYVGGWAVAVQAPLAQAAVVPPVLINVTPLNHFGAHAPNKQCVRS